MIELDSSLVSYFDIANRSFATSVFQCNSSFLICTPSRPLFLFAIVLQTRSVRDAGESWKYGLSEFAGKMTLSELESVDGAGLYAEFSIYFKFVQICQKEALESFSTQST